MRKNSPRKWLHAILDLLPVILIPVFMIYSHRHTIDSGSIDVPQNQVVDFNQLVRDNTEHTLANNSNYDFNSLTYFNEGVYVVSFKLVGEPQNNDIFLGAYNSNYVFVPVTTSLLTNDTLFNNIHYCRVSISQHDDFITGNQIFNQTNATLNISTLTFTNLTQMFGSGNEPSLEQYLQWYPNPIYDYTLSHKELLKGVSTISYSDTDIMSQFTYQLYNSVDKYFNMGNVFNMTSVYDWFNLNIFGGNAPISIYIVWNIVLYEFVMDLLFLLYGLFMWFIDMVEHIMDKPFKSIK